MTFAKGFAVTLLALIVGNVCSTAGPPSTLGKFSFDYAIDGDPTSRPVQVFDDGQRTYMQFRPGAPVPALLSANGDKLFMPSVEGPYIVIVGVPKDFVAQLGLSRTRVTHASVMSNAVQHSRDGRGVPPAVRSVQLASAAPVQVGTLLGAGPAAPAPGTNWRENSYAKPWRGDDIEWADGLSQGFKQHEVLFAKGERTLTPAGKEAVARLARLLPGAGQVMVMGRDDGSYKEGLAQARTETLIEELVRLGVARSIIVGRPSAEVADAEVKLGRLVMVPSQIRWRDAVRLPAPLLAQTPVAPQPVQSVQGAAPADIGPRDWEMRASDQNVQKMLVRWAGEAGWDLVWREGPSIGIKGDMAVGRREFLDAASLVIAQARSMGHKVKATAYAKPNTQGKRTLVIEGEQ